MLIINSKDEKFPTINEQVVTKSQNIKGSLTPGKNMQ